MTFHGSETHEDIQIAHDEDDAQADTIGLRLRAQRISRASRAQRRNMMAPSFSGIRLRPTAATIATNDMYERFGGSNEENKDEEE